MRKNLLFYIIVCLILAGSVNSAYAQFWKKWFNKDGQAQKVEPAKEAKAPEKQVKNSRPIKSQTDKKKIKELSHTEAQAIVEKQLAKDMEELKSSDANAMAEQAAKSASESAQEKAKYSLEENIKQGETAPEDMSDSEKEEQLRQTQERVDQIRKTNEFNNAQKSLDNINKINEFNKQQKRTNDLNKLNKQQKNIDDLNKLNAVKK